MQKFKDVPVGTPFESKSVTFLKIKAIGVSDGDPWQPGRGDRHYSAARFGDGELVEVSDNTDVLVRPLPA